MSHSSDDVSAFGTSKLTVKELRVKKIVGAWDSTATSGAQSDLTFSVSNDANSATDVATFHYDSVSADHSFGFSNPTLIKNLKAPVAASDAATKAYVDASAGGGGSTNQVYLESVTFATTMNMPFDTVVAPPATSNQTEITFNGTSTNSDIISYTANSNIVMGRGVDTLTIVPGSRVLVKDQNSPQFNGVYTIAQLSDIGASSVKFTRTSDLNTAAAFQSGMTAVVTGLGAVYQGSGFTLANTIVTTLGTTPIRFYRTIFSTAVNTTPGEASLRVSSFNYMDSSNALSDANIVKGALHLSARANTMASTPGTYYCPVIYGGSTSNGSIAVVPHNVAGSVQLKFLKRTAANTWTLMAAISDS